MRRLATALEASQVRQVATLRPFAGGLAGFVEESLPEPCEMTWTMNLGDEDVYRAQEVRIYRRASV